MGQVGDPPDPFRLVFDLSQLGALMKIHLEHWENVFAWKKECSTCWKQWIRLICSFLNYFLNMFTLYYSSYQQTYPPKKSSQMDVTSFIYVVNFFVHSFISLSSCFPLWEQLVPVHNKAWEAGLHPHHTSHGFSFRFTPAVHYMLRIVLWEIRAMPFMRDLLLSGNAGDTQASCSLWLL